MTSPTTPQKKKKVEFRVSTYYYFNFMQETLRKINLIRPLPSLRILGGGSFEKRKEGK